MLRCPFMKKTCLPSQCMFGVKTNDGDSICGIVNLMHNVMVMAIKVDAIADKLLKIEEEVD